MDNAAGPVDSRDQPPVDLTEGAGTVSAEEAFQRLQPQHSKADLESVDIEKHEGCFKGMESS